jgi:hypothetical protein
MSEKFKELESNLLKAREQSDIYLDSLHKTQQRITELEDDDNAELVSLKVQIALLQKENEKKDLIINALVEKEMHMRQKENVTNLKTLEYISPDQIYVRNMVEQIKKTIG